MDAVATHHFMTSTLEFAEYIYAYGVIADEQMPIEPEGWNQEDWATYHNELVDTLAKVNEIVPPPTEWHGDETDELQDEEVHPMYCRWCGAEYGEEWAQCECFDELEIES